MSGSAACPSGGTSASGTAAKAGSYCVDGAPAATDHAYWIATSDHLAQDTLTGNPETIA